MKPTTPTQYPLSPEFFADRREILAQRKAELQDRHDELLKEVRAIDDELALLDADEKLAAGLADRYGAVIASELPKTRAKPRPPTPKRPVPSGRPWTPEEEAAVMFGDTADDEALAVQIHRKIGSIEKRRRKIMRDRQIMRDRPPAAASEHPPERAEVVEPESKPSEAHVDAVDEAGSSSETNARLASGGGRRSWAHGEDDGQTRASAAGASGSLAQEADGEKTDTPTPNPALEMEKFAHRLAVHESYHAMRRVVAHNAEQPDTPAPDPAPEAVQPPDLPATSASESLRELAEADGRRARLPPAKPGISVTGRLMDNGPADQRVYGPGWSRSE